MTAFRSDSIFRYSRNHGPWTEEPPVHLVVRLFWPRFSKTLPGADSNAAINNIISEKALTLGYNERVEYVESDISSASGPSTSVSSPSIISSPEFDRSECFISPRDIRPETHKNTTYASKMPMFEFRRHQGNLAWDFFVQSLRKELPHKLGDHNRSFELIDYGGSGIVYATGFQTDKGFDTLAVKVLLQKKKAEIDVSLPAELQIMSRLNHNHIVAYVAGFHRKGQFALLMYPVAICNLAEYLNHASEYNNSGGGLDSHRTKNLTRAFGCLASALMYLHGTLNIKHKDIKPENILITRHGSVILADFGISKQYEAKTITEGTTSYTDKYAPPEVVNQEARDLSADIWSLGCVFLEMATIVLGETLDNLSEVIHGANNRPSYHSSQPKVQAWVAQLKARSKKHTDLSMSALHTDSHLPTAQHLDLIHQMISRSPEERPSIYRVHEAFKSFASRCEECQSSNVSLRLPTYRYVLTEKHYDFQVSQEISIMSPKFEVRPSVLQEIDHATGQDGYISHFRTHESFHRRGSGWKDDNSCFQHFLRLCGTQFQMSADIDDDDAEFSEDDSCSDSGIVDDPVYDQAGSDCYIEEMLNQHFLQHKDFFLSLHERLESVRGITSCPSDGFSGNRRQGSPMQGPPSKRRSNSSRKAIQTPGGDGDGDNDEDDNKGDPNERRGRQSRKGSDSSLMSRNFACPYRKYQPNRDFGGHDCDAGWPQIYRLKEHLNRCHRIYRCPRCQEIFVEANARNQHLRSATPCDLSIQSSVELQDWGQGFDDEQSTKLRARERNVPDEEKWRRLYKILFPNVTEEDIPLPYIEGPLQLPSGVLAEVRRRKISEARLLQIFSRVLQQHFPIPQHQQSIITTSSIHDSAQVEPQDFQQPTPVHTQTSLDSDQIRYPDQTQALITNNHYTHEQFMATGHMSSTVGSSMTRDSSYYTHDPATQQPPLADVYRQRQHPEISLNGSFHLNNALGLYGMELPEPDLDNIGNWFDGAHSR